MDMESVLTAADLAAFGEGAAPSQSAADAAASSPSRGSQGAESAASSLASPPAGGEVARRSRDGEGGEAAQAPSQSAADAAASSPSRGSQDEGESLPEGLTAVPPEAVRAAAAAAAYRARAEDFAAERCRGWLDEAAAFGEREPDFDLAARLRAGGVFPCLLRYGLPLAEAWRAANVDAVARRAAERARIALADDIRARGLRPAEAGAAAVPAFAQREDVAGLSDAEVRAVLGRVERRERVSFG